jgi:hypothetical protein
MVSSDVLVITLVLKIKYINICVYRDDDKIGTLDLSFCTKTRDRLACARSDWTVKVWSFQHDPIGHSTS